MTANSAEPCLYFVRSWSNSRATAWTPLRNVHQEHRITSHELQQATNHLIPTENGVPSFWTNNPVYQAGLMGAFALGTPQKTFAILKLPVRLAPSITDEQALDLVNQIEPRILRNLVWNSSNLHSVATVNHLPSGTDGARGFYKRGAPFFLELKNKEQGNPEQVTIGHKYGLKNRQIEQQTPVTTQKAPAPVKRTEAVTIVASASLAAVTPTAKPSHTFNLHKKLGLKGGHPDPGAIKTLKRIWSGQKEEAAPPPKSDVPTNN